MIGGGERSELHPALLHGDFELSREEAERRELQHRICEEAGLLAEKIVLTDAVRADAGGLREVLAAIRALSERVDSLPSHPDGLNHAPGWQAALTERSPISGRSNPIAAPLFLVRDGDVLRGHATYGRRHEGPFDHVHGGVVMGAFDELLGVAQSASGQPGYTGTLEVVMRAPTPLFERIDYEGGVGRVEGRKVFMWGRSTWNGKLLCEAEGIFVSPRSSSHAIGRIADRE